MPRVLVRPRAMADLDEIWFYIARDNQKRADLLLEQINEKFQTFAEFPFMGTNRDELLPSLQSFTVGNYVIFFFALEGGIEIIRVLQGMRDIHTIWDA